MDKIKDGQGIMKKYAPWVLAPLIVAAGIISLFYYLGHGDSVKLSEFTSAYEKYDQAISALSDQVLAPNLESNPAISDLEQNAAAALVELNTRAAAQISSITLHDGDLMKTMAKVSDLCAQELDALRAYQAAAVAKNADAPNLAQAFNALTSQRRAAYVLFREFAGLND